MKRRYHLRQRERVGPSDTDDVPIVVNPVEIGPTGSLSSGHLWGRERYPHYPRRPLLSRLWISDYEVFWRQKLVTLASPRSALKPGDLLGRYELLLPIAKGGMGQVWAARLHGTRGFQKIVAIKTILASDHDDQQLESMLLSEAALASRIKHPNVVEGLDLGEHDGTLYFVMEWVAGEPLNCIMKSAAAIGGIPLPITVHVIAQACKGLAAAHEARDDSGQPLGLVHRDISPQNLLVSYSGLTKLTDFGVAKATQRMAEVSAIGQVKGKFAYMSPEQVRGGPIDGRSDIFAMGIVLYRMVAGKHPFKGETPTETLTRILCDEPPPPPSTFAHAIAPELDAIVMRALAHDRSARFENAREMQLALEHAVVPSETCSESDLEAFMLRLFGARATERGQALRQAVELADAIAKAEGSAGKSVRRAFGSTRRAGSQGKRRSAIGRVGVVVALGSVAAMSFVRAHHRASPLSQAPVAGGPDRETAAEISGGAPSALPVDVGLTVDGDRGLVPASPSVPSSALPSSEKPVGSTAEDSLTKLHGGVEPHRTVRRHATMPLAHEAHAATSENPGMRPREGGETTTTSARRVGRGEEAEGEPQLATGPEPAASSRPASNWDPLAARK